MMILKITLIQFMIGKMKNLNILNNSKIQLIKN